MGSISLEGFPFFYVFYCKHWNIFILYCSLGGYPSSSLPRAPPGGYPDDDDDYTDQLRKMQMSLNGPMVNICNITNII